MIQNIIRTAIIFMCFGAAAALLAQTPDVVKPTVVMGDVVSISDGKLVVNSKDGPVDALLSTKTEYKRVLPDNPSLKTATPAALTDIGVGDKLVVTGFLSNDKKSIPARTVYLM